MSDLAMKSRFAKGWIASLGFLPIFGNEPRMGKFSDDRAALQSDALLVNDDARIAFDQFQSSVHG